MRSVGEPGDAVRGVDGIVGGAEPAQPRGIQQVWAGVGISVVVMAASVASFALTANRCSGDGSFDPFGPQGRASWYCRAVHRPSVGGGFTAAGLLFSILVFALPTVLVILATIRADRRGSYRPLVVTTPVSAVIVATSFVLLSSADVTAVPVG